ncbi:hypothetical protein M758_3G133900 [Ceratodon purpureus]|nr:hypothetical protein M758_3G133900 [Ceratodon purpureus]
MASRSSSTAFLSLSVIILLFAVNAHALEIVNKQSCKVTVFAPPICQPCVCPSQVNCKKEPCPQNCFCTLQCRFVPGVEVKAGERKTLPVKKEDFPLAFLTVEVEELAYNVQAADLKSITQIATVVVTRKACGKGNQGIVALVYGNPKFAQSKRVCLVRGERYGS